MEESGSVLLQVLVMGAVLALIAASLLRMELFRAQMGARGAAQLAEKRAAAGAVANLFTYWNNHNMVCANDPASGYSCYGVVPGNCGCTCVPTAQTSPPTLPTVTTSGTPDACHMTIITPDSP